MAEALLLLLLPVVVMVVVTEVVMVLVVSGGSGGGGGCGGSGGSGGAGNGGGGGCGEMEVVGGRVGGRADIFPTCDALSPASQSRATRVSSIGPLNGPFRSS